jgi:hypothetical protein
LSGKSAENLRIPGDLSASGSSFPELLFTDFKGGTASPNEILRNRYAAGEIDTQEYARRLAELNKTKPAA